MLLTLAAAWVGIQYGVLYVVSESYLPSASSNHRFPSQFELSLSSTTQYTALERIDYKLKLELRLVYFRMRCYKKSKI